MNDKITYVYILSQRYSGSTLLSFLLAAHPAVSTIGERRKFFVKSIRPNGKGNQNCSCGRPFQECAYWNAIRQKLLSEVPERALRTNATEFQLFRNKPLNQLAQKTCMFCFVHGLPLSWWPFSGKIKELCDFNRRLVSEVLNIDRSKVFLDSSKVLDNALFLSLIETFDLHIIWLVRDPRAQVSSALKYNDWTVEQAAERWTREMKVNETVLAKWQPKCISLQYESLCREPEKELKRIFEFIGLESPAISLDFRAQTQHIMGNTSMRLGKENEIVERKDWLEKLSTEEIALIGEIASDYRHYFS